MPVTDPSASPPPIRGVGLWRSLSTAWRPEHSGPRWAPWAWTVALSLLIGLSIRLLASGVGTASAFVTSVLIGVSIHAIFNGIGRAARWDMFELPLPLRALYGVAVSLAGATLGFAASRLVLTGDPGLAWRQLARGGPVLVSITVFCALTTYVLLAAVARLRQARAERVARQLAASEARREADLARLQLLNAQIEPHFLYNSLAHVDALIGPDPDGARALLGALIEYLRLASRNMARETVAVEDELASVRGYVDVMRHRMGPRLDYVEHVDPAAGRVMLPPASVQTLVENAIKHGLEPLAQGGRLELSATLRDGRCEIAVRDSGAGIAAAPARASSGVGLANLRERLRLSLGGRARLTLSSPPGGGTIASIRIDMPGTHR